MTDVAEFIQSGILEMYVMGCTTAGETVLVEQMAVLHPEVREEIATLGLALEAYGLSNAISPPPTAEPFLMATIAYAERLKHGEEPAAPPRLSATSRIEDFNEWLQRPDLQLPEDFPGASAHIIGHTASVTTAIVWLGQGAPPEVHNNEIESFLIVEGTCSITIGEQVYNLQPGDFLSIPLHANHFVQVTSSCPCKLVLERAAA